MLFCVLNLLRFALVGLVCLISYFGDLVLYLLGDLVTVMLRML